MTIPELHTLFLRHPLACTDTRNIHEGCIFFALRGERFNGNDYAVEALQKGAAYVVVDDPALQDNHRTILVDEVLVTLQELATYHRAHCSAKVVALTGSNGKTTTKELISRVLTEEYRTVATQGNLNNHIGVPLTLLSIAPDTEIAVVEMGANHLGEIGALCRIAQPDYGYITNFGKAHLEGFGSEKGVIEGKSELYQYLLAHNKFVFMNADDPVQREQLAKYIKKIGFSTQDSTYYIIQFTGADPFVRISVAGTHINTRLVGAYNFTNCAAAILIGKYFNVPLERIKHGIETYEPRNNRSQILERNGLRIILDSYNANPTSMRAALENLNTITGNRKVAILGDMFELGASSAEEHQRISDLASTLELDSILLVGEAFHNTRFKGKKFRTFAEVADYLKKNPPENATVLVKGSRGMALERLLEVL